MDLATGRETRRPLTDQEVLAFRVTEYGPKAHPNRRHIGPIDVVTDARGRPKPEPRHTHTRQRPSRRRRSNDNRADKGLFIPGEVRRLRNKLRRAR